MQKVSDERLEELVKRYAGDQWANGFESMEDEEDVGEALRELQQLRGQWVSVNDRLPERGVLVLVYTTSGRIDTDAVNEHDGIWECDDDWSVTRWRELPAAPSTEESHG